MRVAIFSDVHGNLTALRAVLDHIDGQSGFDQVIFAGDLCVFGPRPRGCLELVRERQIPGIVGNTDKWLWQPPPLSGQPGEAQRRRLEYLRAVCGWTAAQLDSSQLDWLGEDNFPFQRLISPSDKPLDDLLIVHANPKDLSGIIFPGIDRQMELYGRIRQDDEQIEALLDGVSEKAIAFGHLHIPGVRSWKDTKLVNVSSVSMPGDADARAKYAVLTWNAGTGWTAEHIRVSYDISEEIAALRDAQPPAWKTTVGKLEALGYFPQVV